MIVNRLQMDLQSKNYLEVATALIATSELLTADMIPALIHLVYQALKHKEYSSRFSLIQIHCSLQGNHASSAFPSAGSFQCN